jgi:branched-chain amino acid transport system substrate-binding protein
MPQPIEPLSSAINRRVLLAGAASCTATLALSGCGDYPNMIRIVSSLPRTGSVKGQTDTIVNGIRLALEEVDFKVAGFHLAYSDLDDATAAAGQWTPDAETSNALRAVGDVNVMAYIGPFNSGAAKVSMPILNKAGVLMVSPANTWPGLTKPGIGEPGEPEMYQPTGKLNYIRVVPADDLQGPLAADWAKEMGLNKVFVIDDKEVYGKGLATMFTDRAEAIGLDIVGASSIDPKSLDFKAFLRTVKDKGPDLIYFGGTTQSKGGQLAMDMVDVGLDAKIMVPDGCYEQAFIDSAGSASLEGRCYVTFGGLPPEKYTGAALEFKKKYEQRFAGKPPEGYAIYGYEAAGAVIEAIRRAGKKDRTAIIAAALSIEDFHGALGTWSIDENGDTTLTTISGLTVKDGKFEFVKLLGSG